MISKEVAQADVERWLDFKKVRASKREKLSSQIDKLVEYVEDGIASIDENCVITQELTHPLEQVSKLTFKPRITVGELALYTKSAGTIEEQMACIVQALTSQAKGVINNLDSEDLAFGNIVALFFLT